MKIWFPLTKADSGADVYTVRLSEALRQYGIDSSISYFPKYYEFAPYLIGMHRPPAGTDVIHTNSWMAFAFRQYGIPLVATVHLPVLDPAYSEYKSIAQKIYHQLFVRRFEKASIEHSDKITTVSNFVGTSIKQTYGNVASETIYNFVDTNQFRPVHKKPRKDREPFRLLFVGNLTRRKGSDLLGPIMEKLGADFELYATTGLRRHAFSLKGNNIHNIGKLTGRDVVTAYQQADALIFPTRLEGFGYSVLEAMACGIPVIASSNSSIPEIIQHDKTGILCRTDDVDAFVEACRTLRNNPSIAESYGRTARERVISSFSEHEILRQYIDLYSSLLSK